MNFTLRIFVVCIGIAPTVHGANIIERSAGERMNRLTEPMIAAWTMRLDHFFNSKNPDISTVSNMLPTLAQLDRSDPDTRVTTEGMAQRVNMATQRLTEELELQETRPISTQEQDDMPAKAKKLAVIKEVFTGWVSSDNSLR